MGTVHCWTLRLRLQNFGARQTSSVPVRVNVPNQKALPIISRLLEDHKQPGRDMLPQYRVNDEGLTRAADRFQLPNTIPTHTVSQVSLPSTQNPTIGL